MTIPVILGPTAVGKTELMLNICTDINAEIVSVDSRQIYKYMDIGTAKPTEEERKIVKHHLIDYVDPSQNYTAYDYRLDALKVIENILERNKFPVFVGGTGLYMDAVMYGFFDAPPEKSIRRFLRKLEDKEPGILRRILKDIDPESALKIHPHDIKRTVRAIEVFIITGKRISFLKEKREGSKYNFKIIILDRDRTQLHERINERVDKMIKKGLIDEVKKLLEMGYNKNLNSLNTIGYKEVIEYLEGKFTFEKMVHLIKRNTRRYARRQIIYFRRYENAVWINLTESNFKENKKKIKELITECFG